MKIPKLFHQIWLGPKPFPAEYRRFSQTWRAHHPEWEIRLWTDADLPALGLRNSSLLGRVNSYSEQSDILRYELLHRFGGIYVDADFECLRPIAALVEPHSLFAGQDKTAEMLNTGLLGCVPGHRFLDWVIEMLPRNMQLCAEHGLTHPNHTVGTWYFSRAALEVQPSDLHVFPTATFYPYLWDEMHRRNEDFRTTTPQAYAVHHWSFSWADQELAPKT